MTSRFLAGIHVQARHHLNSAISASSVWSLPDLPAATSRFRELLSATLQEWSLPPEKSQSSPGGLRLQKKINRRMTICLMR